MYFLDFEDFEIAGASPESLVKVDGPPRRAAADRRHAAARATPRRRTSSAAEELLADEKERAEHVMLVDLAPQRPRPRLRVRHGRRSTS